MPGKISDGYWSFSLSKTMMLLIIWSFVAVWETWERRPRSPLNVVWGIRSQSIPVHTCTHHWPLTFWSPGHTNARSEQGPVCVCTMFVKLSSCVWCVYTQCKMPVVMHCFHRCVTSDLVTSQKQLVCIKAEPERGFSIRTSALILIRRLTYSVCSVWISFYCYESPIQFFWILVCSVNTWVSFTPAQNPDGM